MTDRMKDLLRVSAIVAIAILAVGAAGATAAKLITSEDIKGSARADLQGGPFVPGSAPPYGEGSLGLGVSDDAPTGGVPQEKLAFGNETELLLDPVSGLSAVGFHVFQTGENAGISPTNLPDITFEIDPNLGGGDDYSSMVFLPDAVASVNEWSGYIDATSTGGWFLTGGEGGITGCTGGTPCTFAALQAALDDGGDGAVILTAAIAKGRDSAWVGAVDGFRINGIVYDFEPLGVAEVSP